MPRLFYGLKWLKREADPSTVSSVESKNESSNKSDPLKYERRLQRKRKLYLIISMLYPYLSFSDLNSVHKAFAMSFFSLLQLSSCCPPLGRNSGRADLFTSHGQLRYPDFHHLLSNRTKQLILSYQFGSRMWIYFAILVNFVTL